MQVLKQTACYKTFKTSEQNLIEVEKMITEKSNSEIQRNLI